MASGINTILNADFMFKMLARILVLLTAMPVHECAHAFVANLMGDRTAKEKGRMTLNPLAHLSPIGSVMIMLVGVGFAKPVPIDPRNFKNRKLGEVCTSLAGPFSNVVMAFITLAIWKSLFFYSEMNMSTFGYNRIQGPLVVLEYMVYINCSLAVFNILPIPPLDGFMAAGQLLPTEIFNWIIVRQEIIYSFLMILLFTDMLNGPLAFASTSLLNLLFKATFFIEILFGAA